MTKAQTRGQFDWLVELGGAIAFGLAVGFAAFKLAPSLDLAPAAPMIASAAGAFGLGLLAMRAVKPEPREHALAGFAVETIERREDVLLLDTLDEEPLLLTEV